MKKTTVWGKDENDNSVIDQIINKGKTVICTPKYWYDKEPEISKTKVGDLVAIYTKKGEHACNIEITEKYEIPFGQVTERIAKGELFNSIEEFKEFHKKIWSEELNKDWLAINDDTIIVVEHFKLHSIEN
ncbi:hypothetical protein OSSY52_11190 [Tepiditoga spiralis]|uniref:ASCH domain-containing protein n=1 Tax=Tepiditoga spiralis TaxID=2108365 RepID=A0A7G1G3H7_9BACT|nr:ASCH domain-containing protein [Tepiditoga spiralis]BBE30978.1 hypothetical protein OSSY52_11190 [Tepiditoga spiralis]